MSVRRSAPHEAQPRRKRGTGGVARRLLAGAAVSGVVVGGINVAPTFASSVTSAAFGGAGTVKVGDTVYAKQGTALTLAVVTSNDTKCVDVSGAAALPRQSSSTAKTDWTFTTTAPAGNGAQAFTVAASPNVNPNGCSGNTNSTQASYTLDNTGPVVTAALTPAPTSFGWNNSDVVVRWTATDSGAGVSAAQPFQTDSAITQNGTYTRTAPAQSDRLGNTGAAGSVTVRIDKAKPSINAVQTKNPDGTTTVTFTCDDTGNGGGGGNGDASGVAICLADGTSTNSKTVQPGVTVTGTATDKAGNTATASSTAPASDTTAPLLSGAPTTPPNGNGWYKGDVTIHWTASDPESGIPTPPTDTTISSEGTGLTSTKTVTNGAGLQTTATSSPAVKIDRTAPSTTISGTSNAWVNGAVNVTLAAGDNLSGVASTSYSVDGAPLQIGKSFSISSEGSHTVDFTSTDNAGNVEATKTVLVMIDRTAPTIEHSFVPSDYSDGGWTNQDVTVTFACADQGGSGLADCTAPVSVATEGESQPVVGAAKDNAGNSASDTALVSIDKTAPKVAASVDRPANTDGWYNDDVTVRFSATDALSGVATKSADKVLGQGTGQSASGSATDKAGNSASAGVTGINVDKTAPVLVGSSSSGWHTGDVTVTWSCTDEGGSGVKGAQPADTIVGGEGANLSATASCQDVAGNSVTETVTGIDIDRHAPATSGAISGSKNNGWYSSDVEVTLSASDNLSKVATTFYKLDGAESRVYEGPFSVSADGAHSVEFWSKDGAGNTETVGAPLAFKIDQTAPTTKVIDPVSPASGWFVTSGIPFAFEAKDAGSGIGATYYTIDDGTAETYGEPFTQDLSTGTHTVTYWSTDVAGNKETVRSFDVNVDSDAPTIKGSASPAANDFGWNNTDVDVTFECADVGSGLQTGVAGCSGDTTLTNNGADQAVNGNAVDVAGNTSSTSYGPVNIDKVKPTLTGVYSAGNAAGWHNGDVTVSWVGDDALSKIDPATQPKDSTITGEGSDLKAGPATISDKAGNISDPASVSGVKIDRSAPTVKGAATTKPNAAGWYTSSVTVDYTCADPQLADGSAGSGIASCPTSTVLSGNGAGQSTTSGGATDRAGNSGAGVTVDGVNIDGTAPSTTANNSCTAVNGWCTGSTADVILTAVDQAGLSGVKEIHYVIDGGTEQVAGGATTTVSVPLTDSGAGTVRYWAVDNADNVEPASSVSLKWDNVAPTLTHSLDPVANAAGWSKADTTVRFTAKDDDKGSGVDASTVTAPVTVSQETNGTVVNGSAKDFAGNVGKDSATVRLDKTAPTITGAITSGTKGTNGWYTGPVTVTFTCSDELSGIPAKACPDPVTLTANGSGQNSTGKVVDAAGNEATATVSGINIDQEKPTLTAADVNVQGGTFTLGNVPTASCSSTDNVSGIASCEVSVTGGNANGAGAWNYKAVATDKAGNTTTLAGTYRVIYRFDGFLQPINDTAHQVGTSTSVFKAGSTVPAKLQLKKADGTVVQATSAPVWLTPVKGSAMSAPVDETVYSASADSGTTYRYDATAQQYIYNWKTGSASGNYWRIGVTFDDGQTYYVNIGLR